MGAGTTVKKTLGEQLIEEVVREFGPISFERFVELALYHPRYGYYQRGEPQRGRAGDYFTSLQVSDLFPKAMAEAISAMKQSLDTDQFALVEWGAGDGEFLAGVLQALDDKGELKGLRAWAVEASRPARDRLRRKLSRFPKCAVVSSLDEIESIGGLEGCFYSNEFFDALPFRRFRYHNQKWFEIYIDKNEKGLVEIERASELPDGFLKGLSPEEGQELEYRPALDKWCDAWGAMLTRGYVLTVDYGSPRSELLAPHRRNGTWRGFFEHKLQTNALAHIGRQDLTANADFTHLSTAGLRSGWEPSIFCSQGVFLSHVGAPVWEKALANPDISARARVSSALQQLLHPSGMGESFSVLLQIKDAEFPPPFRDIPNRIKRVV